MVCPGGGPGGGWYVECSGGGPGGGKYMGCPGGTGECSL